MRNRSSKVNGLLIIIFLMCIVIFEGTASASTQLQHQPLIAHAGGHIYGYKYTNSLEALENSYNNGFRFIELDFDWTADNQIVLIHDWSKMASRLFMTEPRVFTKEEFDNTPVLQNLTLLDIENLAKWLEDRSDVNIVTDVKNRNLDCLQYIGLNYEHIKNQIVPQVYSFDEYIKAKQLGYDNIILTLYKSNYTDDEIMGFAKNNEIFAITMPIERGYTELPRKLKESGVLSYVHTVNDLYTFEELNLNGVYGIYTDYFQMNHWAE